MNKTWQEAIKTLTKAERFHSQRAGCDFIKALSIAKNSLEKQIPKKPTDIEGDYTCYYGICPSCKNGVNDLEDYKYCNECGQALDWGDTNE